MEIMRARSGTVSVGDSGFREKLIKVSGTHCIENIEHVIESELFDSIMDFQKFDGI